MNKFLLFLQRFFNQHKKFWYLKSNFVKKNFYGDIQKCQGNMVFVSLEKEPQTGRSRPKALGKKVLVIRSNNN